MPRRLLIWICVIPLACARGPRASSFAPALRPGGAAVTLDSGQRTFDGELLAVTDTALVLLRGGMVAVAPYGAIEDVMLPQFDADYAIRYARPDTATLSRLRLRSRFPQGLTPELLARLLAAYHQDALTVLP
jgi:hypothetical protein